MKLGQHTIVPAPAGWYVSVIVENEIGDGAFLTNEPIVAWDIEYDIRGVVCVTPICLNALTTKVDNRWVIRDPAGTYYDNTYGSGAFASAQEVIEFLYKPSSERKQHA